LLKNKQIKTRINDKFFNEIHKKLQLKKFQDFDMSKFIRAAIDNFIEKDYFNYVSDTNAIISILEVTQTDMYGLYSNITQIQEHYEDTTNTILIDSMNSLSIYANRNRSYISKIKELLSLLMPYERNYIKNQIVEARIDDNQYKFIMEKIESFDKINFDMSKFIRAALKYYLDKKLYLVSDAQVLIFRELIKDSKDIDQITNRINQVAFYLHTKGPISDNEVVEEVNNLGRILEEVHHTVVKLYDESVKII